MSEIATPAAGNETLEQSLNKTDMGHWMYEHRKSFFAALGVVLLGTVGYVLWKQSQHKEMVRLADQVHQFEVGAVADLKAKKMTPEEFATKFNALDGKVKVTPAMVPVATDAARTMVEMGDAARAQSVLKPLVETNGVTASSTAYMFIALNYAALAETNGDNDEAIRVLESYTKSGHKVMLAKAYLDLGRLYLAKGDQAKAKTNLDYIVANYPNDELAKLARLYLQKLTATP